MFEWLSIQFGLFHAAVFESVVQPVLFSIGLIHHAEPAFEGTYWFLVGLVEIGLLALVVGGAQRRWPVEPITEPETVRTDFFYTVLHRLGLFGIAIFLLVQPIVDLLKSQLTLAGFQPIQADHWFDWLIPNLSHNAVFSFCIYLIALDFVDYWMHRGQHRIQLWWQLHALHHAQRQMTLWSDNRNHLLDDLLRDVILAIVALLIGVAPGQFVLLVVVSRAMQSLQHANIRWQFPFLLERVLVSPSFHRLHHAIGFGHEGKKQGCNFGVLFSFWDAIFRTADWRPGFVPTGVRDQLTGRDYGKGFFSQQWLGLKRLFNHSA